MADQGLYSIFVSAVMLIRVDPVYGRRLSNCWLPAATWVEALQKTGHIDAGIVIDVRKFNTAMSKAPLFGSVMTRFDGSNQSGVFRVTYHHQHFYYLTQETRQAVYPSPLNRAWRDRVVEVAANVLTIPCTRATRPNLTTTQEATDNTDNTSTDTVECHPSSQKRPRLQQMEEDSTEISYWPDSPEARQLFQPITPAKSRRTLAVVDMTDDANETAKEALQRRIRMLQSVYGSGEGWRNVIICRDEKNLSCSKVEIFEI